jgi:pyruvate dehydrogenase E1 component alpha subunit
MRSQHDCIDHARQLLTTLGVDDKQIKDIDDEVKAIIQDAADYAQASPEPDPAELWTDILLEG